MPNITVAVSQTAYREARVWAAQNDMSISAIVQYCIERLPRLPIAQKAMDAHKTAQAAPPEKNGCETVIVT